MGRWKDDLKNGFGVSTKAANPGEDDDDEIDVGIFKNGHLLLYELALENNASFWLYVSSTPELKEKIDTFTKLLEKSYGENFLEVKPLTGFSDLYLSIMM